MPHDPNTTGQLDFSDAPGGDTLFDDMFSSEGTIQGTDTTTNPTASQPQVAEPFLKTATGTVYKSVDEAVAGIEHKDALITQLRQELEQRTGEDPIRRRKEEPEPQVSYLENPKKYFEDIKKAKSEEELITVQKRFVDEQLMPYAGLIASVAKTRAVDEVASDVPEITTFLRSDDYKTTLDKYPLLKQSVQIAESNPQAAGDLAQLYRMAYTLTAGGNLSKLVSTATATHAVPPNVRPTASSTTPAAPSVATVSAASLNTSDGRKALIRDQEDRGVLNLRF